jgi:hypothetical protein
MRIAILATRAERRIADLGRIDMCQLVTTKIRDRKLSEQIIKNGSRILDCFVSANRTGWLEAREGKGIDEFLERNAIL